jgi:hypothetical protein
MRVSGQRHAPATLYPFRYPLDKRLRGTQSQLEARARRKSFAPDGDRTPVVQPVVRHYTAWANAAQNTGRNKVKCIALQPPRALYFYLSNSD